MRSAVVIALVTVVAGVAFFMIAATVAGHLRHHDAVPAIFTPPTVFCPAGQHVTGVGASGWPDCARN
jgi:hypothetical protein